MRRSVKWTIAAAAIAALFAGVYRWPMASARVGAELNRAMPPIGLHWRGPARVTFALLPWPTLRVIGVDLVATDGHNVLTASEAQFPLSILGLMRGRFLPVGATLDSPTALIDLDAAPALAEERAVAEDSRSGGSGAWAHVRLRGGILHIVSASRRLDTLIESLDGGLDWPSAERAVARGAGRRVARRTRHDPRPHRQPERRAEPPRHRRCAEHRLAPARVRRRRGVGRPRRDEVRRNAERRDPLAERAQAASGRRRRSVPARRFFSSLGQGRKSPAKP